MPLRSGFFHEGDLAESSAASVTVESKKQLNSKTEGGGCDVTLRRRLQREERELPCVGRNTSQSNCLVFTVKHTNKESSLINEGQATCTDLIKVIEAD